MAAIKLIFRVLSGLFFALALFVAILDISASILNQKLSLTPLGSSWVEWHPSSLQQFEFGVQQYLNPDIWYSVFTPMLLAPTLLYLAILAVICFLIGRRGRQPRVAIAR